jgi:hypothetical protein
MIFTDNAVEVYRFDAEALAPLAARIGPSVAEVATPVTQGEIPRDALSPAFTRP